jgi:hypothetical protein
MKMKWGKVCQFYKGRMKMGKETVATIKLEMFYSAIFCIKTFKLRIKRL